MRQSPYLPLGLALDSYRIESVLAAGAFAVTYRAVDTSQSRYVALKEYYPKRWARRLPGGAVELTQPQFGEAYRQGLRRFVAEAEALARVRHDCIVRVERIFGALGSAYIALEYIPGPNVETWAATERSGAPAQPELDAFSWGLLGALSAIHRAGMLHRDVAPRNILLGRQGLPVLIDFGSALHDSSVPHSPGTIVVTPHYAPQEQYISTGVQQGAWTDIYSAAALLYGLVEGEPPPPSPARALGHSRIALRSGRAARQYRPEFLEAIEWGLEFFPQDRPQTVDAWRSRLLPYQPPPSARGLRRVSSGALS